MSTGQAYLFPCISDTVGERVHRTELQSVFQETDEFERIVASDCLLIEHVPTG